MPVVIVDGNEIELDPAERLNGIQVAARAGIEIPHYCWHPGLTVVASCRMCLVEAGRRDAKSGEIQMQPRLVPACQTPATDGTVFVTQSEKVAQARAMVEEDLLLRHPVDCPICDKAGECLLQDYHFKYGQEERRADIKPFTSRRRPVGDTVTLFVDRCVMCSRCVRFTHEISGTHELMVVHRGSHEEIDVFPGHPLDNKLSGNVVDLCPVGALGDTDFLYSQRVWFMQRRAHVCAGCSTGCSVWVDENQDRVYRLKPRENPHINEWWMCDDGRYGFKYVHDERRCVTAGQRLASGTYRNVEASALAEALDGSLRGGKRIALLLSPFVTVEEAYLLATYLRSLDASAWLGLGPVPREGEDECFPRGFTIRAEKCPNRRGIEQVVAHFMRHAGDGPRDLDALAAGQFDAVWIAGGYPGEWVPPPLLDLVASTPLTILHDLFPSPLWDRVTYRIPAAAFVERSGSFVNHADRLQSFEWAIRPPAGVISEGQLVWRLLGRVGMYRAKEVRAEVARAITYFSAANGDIPDVGVDLKIPLLAEV